MANMFEVNTINGSVVMAKIAGMESTANNTSENSTTIRHAKDKVAVVLLFNFIKNLPSCIFHDIGKNFDKSEIAELFLKSVSSWLVFSILYAE